MRTVVTKQMEKFAASQHFLLCVGFLRFALCLIKFTHVWLMAIWTGFIWNILGK